VSELEMYGEVGQVAPAVSNRGYARCLLAVAAWTPREAPAAARRRPGRLLDMVTLAGLSNSASCIYRVLRMEVDKCFVTYLAWEWRFIHEPWRLHSTQPGC